MLPAGIAMVIFTVYDSAAGGYLDPFFAPSVEYAMRSFGTAVNKPGHPFNEYPGDYCLFKIGTFDPTTGIIAPENPTSLGVAITFVQAPAPEEIAIA